MVIGRFRVLEFALITWRFSFSIRAGIFIPYLVLDRWAEQVGLFSVQAVR